MFTSNVGGCWRPNPEWFKSLHKATASFKVSRCSFTPRPTSLTDHELAGLKLPKQAASYLTWQWCLAASNQTEGSCQSGYLRCEQASFAQSAPLRGSCSKQMSLTFPIRMWDALCYTPTPPSPALWNGMAPGAPWGPPERKKIIEFVRKQWHGGCAYISTAWRDR